MGPDEVASLEAEQMIPFNEVGTNYPWNGCKCVASAVMLFVSQVDTASKIEAICPVSRSLGGIRIPITNDLKMVRDPYILSKMFSQANKKSNEGICTSILVNTTDVEVMRNPGTLFKSRPGTFAHCFVMTVSQAGVYILHGYGPRGYTLLQHMQSKSSKYPLSFDQAKEWVETFELYASDRRGIWTKEVNQAYRNCFDVDLVALGCMRIGSQLDAYTTVNSLEFNASIVRENFDLLPQKRSRRRNKTPCRDGILAAEKHPPSKYIPDGGVRHYYIPEILRCGHCGKIPSNNGAPHKRCVR